VLSAGGFFAVQIKPSATAVARPRAAAAAVGGSVVIPDFSEVA